MNPNESEQRVRGKRQQTYALVGAIAALVVLAIALIALAQQSALMAPPDEGAGVYSDLPVSATDIGLYRLGDADAPVMIEVFSSFTCPHCANFHKTAADLIDPYVKDGTLSIVFYPLANSQRAHVGSRAVVCAGQQAPATFWALSDVIYSWIGEPYDEARVEEAAATMGLDVEALRACMADEATLDILQAAMDAAIAAGVRGTPALFFNGERPDCGRPGDLCEGNLPYNMVVQNIEHHQAMQ